jgi:hypothetical protein
MFGRYCSRIVLESFARACTADAEYRGYQQSVATSAFIGTLRAK